MPELNINGGEWVRMIAEQLVNSLSDLQSFPEFTAGDKNLLGMYAEARVRELVQRFLTPLRVSRGAIVWERANPVQELDAIVWQPSPLPALFEAGDFAVVPRGSAVGLLEIKHTNYKSVGDKPSARDKARKVLNGARGLVPDHGIAELAGLGPKALGVICIRWRGDAAVADADIVTLLTETENEHLTANVEAFVRLANSLAAMRYRARIIDGATRINLRDARQENKVEPKRSRDTYSGPPSTNEPVLSRFPIQ